MAAGEWEECVREGGVVSAVPTRLGITRMGPPGPPRPKHSLIPLARRLPSHCVLTSCLYLTSHSSLFDSI